MTMPTSLLASFSNDPNAKYILVGVVGVIVLYVVMRPFLQKKKKDPFDRANFTQSLSQQRGVERQMQHLLVELNEMARQMTAQLDSRSTKLELLIKDADERLAELRRATDAARSAAPRFEIPPSSALFAPTTPSQQPSSFGLREPEPDVDATDPTHLQIHQLSDEGKTVSDIAAILGHPSGEIELILALRPKASRV
jgi:hypothetical protein